MKLNRIITLCAVALAISGTSLLAQNNGGDQGGPGGQGDQQRGQRGQRGNFDPAQMEQRMLENYQEQLGFTSDTEWEAVKPLVQKVVEARRDAMSGMGRGMFGGRNRGGNNGDQGNNNRQRGGMFGQQSAEQEALQKAIDDNAPASQIKDLLAKYKTSQKAKQAKLETAQDDLKKVLTTKQEAQAYILGLVR